ncbi:ELKS/Rab6-interacting/CAST family member 1-like [Aphis craccivora]|uniref:ELKS/Rab6-interacting/CAST family member 1-like n=1 Tax=Aphis craccivora TaxID=307492 RepID=A0A6G0XTB1_APHCR|nr:ELKS/Rab6-interacting/CAST family member 1-like [Aphis craccivora]
MGRPSKRALKNKEAIKQIREHNILYGHELEKDKLRKKLSRVSQDIAIASEINRSKRLENPIFKKMYQIENAQNMKKRKIPSDSSLCQSISSNRRISANSTSFNRRELQKLNETSEREDFLISEYIFKWSQGLSEKCYSGHRLRFPSTVNKCNSNLLRKLDMSIATDVKSSVQICTSCHLHIKKSKIPSLYIGNGFELNNVPASVTQLNQIEKQMVSLRLPPSLVVAALNDLINKSLYKDAEIDKDWLAHVTETTMSIENGSDFESKGTGDEDTNMEPINPGTMDTMLENCDFVSFAPGEGMKPLSILIDDHAEEKAFSDLFGVLVQKLKASNVQIVMRKNKKGNTTANDVANPED